MTKHSGIKNQDIATFVELLVQEKNFSDVEPEVIEQIKEDLGQRLENIINAVIVSNLPPEKLGEFDTLLDGKDGDAIAKFCEQNVPNLQEIVTNELTNFRKAYLGIA